MRGFHRAVPQRDLRVVDAFDPKHLDAPDGPDDIENCVDRSDFVKVQLVRCDTMNRTLNGGNRLERRMG